MVLFEGEQLHFQGLSSKDQLFQRADIVKETIPKFCGKYIYRYKYISIILNTRKHMIAMNKNKYIHILYMSIFT